MKHRASHPLSDFTRGGQTTLHFVAMTSQILRVLLMSWLVLSLILSVAWVLTYTTAQERYSVFQYYQAGIYIKNRPDREMRFTLPDGQEITTTAFRIRTSLGVLADHRAVMQRLEEAVWAPAIAGAILAGLMAVGFVGRGRRMRKDLNLRGAELDTSKALTQRIRKTNKRLPKRPTLPCQPGGWRHHEYRLAGVPYVAQTETQGTLVVGAPGTGKTTALADLIAQIRRSGDRAIVYDKMCGFIPKFYDPDKDIIINPLDARSPAWSVFGEAKEPHHFDTMAAAFIPEQKNVIDPFFITAARTIFSEVAFQLRQAGAASNAQLFDRLLQVDLKEMAEMVKGTPLPRL